MDAEFEDFNTKGLNVRKCEVQNGKGSTIGYKSMYTPVSLSPCDEENEEFLNGGDVNFDEDSETQSQFNSEDEDESIGRSEVVPLVLKT
jgi:hypothetical protein